MEEKKKVEIDHPSYYNTGPECIDIMEKVYGRGATYDFCLLNAFKYLYRCDNKDNQLADLEKADWYLQKAIGYLKRWQNE